jgi:hypothetical protein
MRSSNSTGACPGAQRKAGTASTAQESDAQAARIARFSDNVRSGSLTTSIGSAKACAGCSSAVRSKASSRRSLPVRKAGVPIFSRMASSLAKRAVRVMHCQKSPRPCGGRRAVVDWPLSMRGWPKPGVDPRRREVASPHNHILGRATWITGGAPRIRRRPCRAENGRPASADLGISQRSSRGLGQKIYRVETLLFSRLKRRSWITHAFQARGQRGRARNTRDKSRSLWYEGRTK